MVYKAATLTVGDNEGADIINKSKEEGAIDKPKGSRDGVMWIDLRNT